MLTLNIFGTLFWCFHCWLWTSKRWIGRFRKFSKIGIAAKSGKVACLVVQKAFRNTRVFQRKPLDCTQIKSICHSNNQNTEFKISYGWYINLFQPCSLFRKLTQTNPLHQGYFHAYRLRYVSLKYMLNILFSVGTCTVYASLFLAIWILVWLQSPRSFQNFSK